MPTTPDDGANSDPDCRSLGDSDRGSDGNSNSDSNCRSNGSSNSCASDCLS